MKWTAEQDQIARTMKAEGATLPDIGHAIGKSRHAVKNRLRYLSLSPERRKAESISRHANCKPKGRKIARQRITPSSIHFVPAEVLADRERRMLAEQPAFGDPPIGFSMLDRRQSGVSV